MQGGQHRGIRRRGIAACQLEHLQGLSTPTARQRVLTRPVVADAEHEIGRVAGGRCIVQDALHDPPLAHALGKGGLVDAQRM